MHGAIVLTAIMGFGLLPPLLGQQETDGDLSPIFRSERWQDYRVGVGDSLEIQVVDVPEANQTVVVPSSGEINLYPVGNVLAMDLTASELERRIADLFRERDLVQDPQVLVFVREYRANRIYVSGEVLFPGEFQISQTVTVLDAVLLGGGLTPLADDYGYVHRPLSGVTPAAPPPPGVVEKPATAREGTEIIRIDLKPLAEGRVPVPDLTLRSGDYVIVPRRTLEYYFVLGEVVQPLNYVYPRGGTLMVSQAIAGAGGPTKTAKISEGKLVRFDEEGNRQEMDVDFKAILEGRIQDVVVRPNDVIFIPGSIIKTIGEGFVQSSSAMIVGTARQIDRSYRLPGRLESGGGVQ